MKKVFAKVILWIVCFVFLTVGLVVTVQGTAQIIGEKVAAAYTAVRSRLSRTEYIKVFVPAETKPLKQIITEAENKWRIPRILILAMIHQESGTDMRPDRIRFEPEVFKRVRRKDWQTDEEWRLQASSLGLMQVIPYFHSTNPDCQIGFAEFFDPEKNVNCGCSVLKKCLESNAAIRNKADRFRRALVCYNGGEDYPRQVLARLVDITLEQQL